MLIFLYGPDDYRRLERKQETLAKFEKKYSALAVGKFDFSEKDRFEAAEVFASGQSLFLTKKILVIENCFEHEPEKTAVFLRRYLNSPETIILVTAPGDPPQALRFLLKKPVFFEKFPYLAGEQWRIFAREKIKDAGINIAPQATELLLRLYEKNTWGFMTELHKLRSCGKPTLTEKDLAELDLESAPNYWGLVQGLKNPRHSARLHALERLFAEHEAAGKLFNILSAMWGEKIAAFAAYDSAVKMGKLDYEEALLDLALS